MEWVLLVSLQWIVFGNPTQPTTQVIQPFASEELCNKAADDIRNEINAPLKRNVLPDELGATGTFLASDGAAAITGQVIYVDCGYQIMGM